MNRIAPTLLAVSLILAPALGCGDDAVAPDAGPDAAVDTGPIHLVFDLSVEAGFYDQPFPLETRRLASGAPDVTGVPNPQRTDLIPIFVEVVADRDGFSPSGPVWMRMTGPLDAAAFPTPEESEASSSPVFLVNIDADSPERGQRTPVVVEQRTEGDSYRPAHLLSVLPVPGFALEESTLYAVVVRDAVGSGDPDRALEVDTTLLDLLSDRTPAGDGGAELAAAFAPLRTWLAEEGVAAETVVAATVFRTGDVTGDFFRWVEHAGGLAPRAPTGDLTKLFEMPEYCAYGGVWEPPQFQEGTPPFESEGGRFVLDGDGLPVEQRTETAPFVLAVPKDVMPAGGFPLVFYVNGTGGLARQILDRGTNTATTPPPPGTGPAQKLARRGWGASGMAGPLSPERIGAEASVDGFVMYNFLNPAAMRDNFAQAILEHVLFRRLLLALRIDASDCPGVDASAAADGMAHYDPDNLVAMGQSLGSYLAGILAATDAGFEGAVLTGAGGSWIEFAFGPTDPFDLEQVVRILIALPSTGSFDRTHPAIALFDLGVGPADNLHYVDQIWREPRPGHDPVPVLIIEGYDDDNIPENLQRGLVAALGADLVGPEAGPEGSHILETIRLAGGTQRDPAVRDNRMSPAGPITAGVVRYEPDRPLGGHYVTFQLEAPQHQYGCFVQTLYDTGSPTIVAGAGVDDPCD